MGIEAIIVFIVLGAFGLGWIEWRIWATHLANREASLLAAIRSAVSHEIPLSDALYALAPTYRGKYAAKLLAMAAQLEHGFSLPEALAATPGVVSESTRQLLAAGRSTGSLLDLTLQAAELQGERRRLTESIVGRLAYLTFLLLLFANMTAFLTFYIAPKFKAIWSDFGVELPAVTRWIAFDEVEHLEGIVMGFLLLCALGLGTIAVRWFLGIVGAATLEHSTVGRWLIRSRSSETLRGLSSLLAEGRPTLQALDDLNRYIGRGGLARRLARAKLAAAGGAPLPEALARAGLVHRSDAALLTAAEKVGNAPWAMRQLAQSKDRRSAYRINLFVDALYPWAIVGIGGMYGLITVAYFAPLVKTIATLGS